MRGGRKVVVEPHRHSGVFIARGKEDALVTKNLTPGDTVCSRLSGCLFNDYKCLNSHILESFAS